MKFFTWHLRSRNSLLYQLKEKFESEVFHFYPTFSGRTAIYEVAKIFRKRSDKSVALIPDYICNVVNVALEQAGYQVQVYSTNRWLEPESDAIIATIRQGHVGLLLTANIFGSSALLEELKLEPLKTVITEYDIQVIVDLCQDITLIQHLPVDYGTRLVAVVSFNDKSIPGVMGGGILASFEIPEAQRTLSWRQTMILYSKFVLKSFRCSRRQKQFDPVAFEYSYCDRFPYTIDSLKISKIQIILALIGIENISSKYSLKKSRSRVNGNLIKTRYYQTSPYLLTEVDQPHRKRKASYAIQGQPQVSIYPDLIIIHNKGFCD